jgi:hypothetical protein
VIVSILLPVEKRFGSTLYGDAIISFVLFKCRVAYIEITETVVTRKKIK